jgi:hypothetical protein
MVTREQIEEAFGDNRSAFKTKNVDHDFIAISLLRERIPYEVCKSIIGGAEHDVIYLCDVNEAIPYLTEEDLFILADCNCWIETQCDSLALFV